MQKRQLISKPHVIASQFADWRGNPFSFGSAIVTYYVYFLANATNTAIYTGVTNDLFRRLQEHQTHADPNSYTAKYDITKLVYFETTNDIHEALAREKQIKGWNRKRKNKLIESRNPKWEDLLKQVLD